MEPIRRVLLPTHRESGTAWLPALGECSLEPLPGGWLVRPRPAECTAPSVVTLDLSGPAPEVTVEGSRDFVAVPLDCVVLNELVHECGDEESLRAPV